MKTLISAAAIAALTAPAFAQNSGDIVLTNPQFAGGFKNRGQCQAALAKVRNDQRKKPRHPRCRLPRRPSTRGGYTTAYPGALLRGVPGERRDPAARDRRGEATSLASDEFRGRASPAEQAPILG